MDILNEIKLKMNKVMCEKNLERIARKVGFMVRKRKITTKNFLENSMLVELSGHNNTFDELAYEFHRRGCTISKQALYKKTNQKTILFFQQVLKELLEQQYKSHGIDLEKFSFLKEIKVIDSSEIRLSNRLQNIFPHSRHQGAAVKLQAQMEVIQERLLSLEICGSKEPDQGYQKYKDSIGEGDLSIADLGYFCLDSFKEIADKKGFFLSRYFKQTNLYSMQGQLIDLRNILEYSKEDKVELSILLGNSKLACRFVAIRLSEEAYKKRLNHIRREIRRNPRLKEKQDSLNRWSIFVTNLPSSLSGDMIMKIYSLRWQIELMFKVMKTFLRVRKIEHINRYSAFVSLYVSLIAMVILCMIATSITDKEISLYKAGKIFVRNIRRFIDYMHYSRKYAIDWLRKILYKFAVKETRSSRPSTKFSLNLRAIYA